ncbi:hypothetical protein [Mesomycoplasma lagogenitalium]|uniref:Uncharacterized protein n=1 Tax=Mesomycoplasma lagogenitalium TaxID=171286 RepID=A0ABY8LT31_9BACT|nr:hypothetical protein [Mesomycoplasma lagogenitalium]WGI36400.1 hypothetical protein QEG99_02920 [Mesomycoplasma lagogenitalium]
MEIKKIIIDGNKKIQKEKNEFNFNVKKMEEISFFDFAISAVEKYFSLLKKIDNKQKKEEILDHISKLVKDLRKASDFFSNVIANVKEHTSIINAIFLDEFENEK